MPHAVRLLSLVMLINAGWQMWGRSRPCRERLNTDGRTVFCFFSHMHYDTPHSPEASISRLSSSNPRTPGYAPLETSSFLLPLSPNSSLSALPSQFMVHIFSPPSSWLLFILLFPLSSPSLQSFASFLCLSTGWSLLFLCATIFLPISMCALLSFVFCLPPFPVLPVCQYAFVLIH